MGKVISFEGIPGVGKSTLVKNIKRELSLLNLKVIDIRELGDDLAPQSAIRQSVMKVFTFSDDRYFRQYDPHMDTFFSQAARYPICREVIDKNRNRYDIILEDRGIDTYMSYALAGFNKELKLSFEMQYEKLTLMNSLLNEVADLTIRLKDNVFNCVDRSIKRGESQVLEKDIEYLVYVDRAYDFLQLKNPQRIKTIEVNGDTPEKVCERTFNVMRKYLLS